MEQITVSANINASRGKVWDYYTGPEHITRWNFADPSWCCPRATNDLRVGGEYYARMEARDGSAGFDFEATYIDVVPEERLSYEFGGRVAVVTLREGEVGTTIDVTFDPETENSIEVQRAGWQSILNNFKQYVEHN